MSRNTHKSSLIEKVKKFRQINGFSNGVKYRKKKKNSNFRSMAQFERGEPKTFVLTEKGSFERKNAGAICKIKMSNGELKIFTFLKNYDIKFEQEKSFSDCINPRTHFELRFDFFLPMRKICIEFDGAQHFIRTKMFDDNRREFNNRVYRDKLKTEYCSRRNIKLIRISYKELNKIDQILIDILGLHIESIMGLNNENNTL